MTNVVSFDVLAREAMESGGGMTEMGNLYGHAFALPHWHFVARGQLPNVSPYVASNAAYADGKPMLRAFTDTERLQRFAKENNLTDASGGAPILSIPTAGILDYVEGFIQHGVFGIWFNSDASSEGFFAPLAQLRRMKTHLEDTHWAEPVPPSRSN